MPAERRAPLHRGRPRRSRVSFAALREGASAVARPARQALTWRCRMSEASAYPGIAGRITAAFVEPEDLGQERVRGEELRVAVGLDPRGRVTRREAEGALRLERDGLADELRREGGIPAEARDAEAPASERAGARPARRVRHRRHADLSRHRRVARLGESPDVGPVEQEDGMPVLEETAAVVLLQARHARRADGVHEARSSQKFQRRHGLAPVQAHFERLRVDPEAARAAEDLEEHAREALVLAPLPDEAPAAGRSLESPRGADEVLERLGRSDPRLLEQVTAVVEEPDVGPDGNPVEVPAIPARVDRAREKRAQLLRPEDVVERQEPSGRGELRRPRHVHVDDVQRIVARQERRRVHVLPEVGGVRALDQLDARRRATSRSAPRRAPRGCARWRGR